MGEDVLMNSVAHGRGAGGAGRVKIGFVPEFSLHCRLVSLFETEMEAQYALRSEVSKWNFDSEPFGWKNCTEVDFLSPKDLRDRILLARSLRWAPGPGAGHRQDERPEFLEDEFREIAKFKFCWPTLDVSAATGGA